jgi:hypothetical protein
VRCGRAALAGKRQQGDGYPRAQEAYKIRDLIKGAAVEFINCASGDARLFRAMVDIATITTYVDGSLLNKRDYRAKWQK